MKKLTKKQEKACFILYTFTSLIFFVSGISMLFAQSNNLWTGISNIALGVTFGSLAYLYFKNYKSSK